MVTNENFNFEESKEQTGPERDSGAEWGDPNSGLGAQGAHGAHGAQGESKESKDSKKVRKLKTRKKALKVKAKGKAKKAAVKKAKKGKAKTAKWTRSVSGSVAGKIRAYRKRHQLDQRAAAAKLKIGQSSLCDYENGKRAPRQATALRLAALLRA